MSDIQQLIEAVREDGSVTRDKLSENISWQEMLFDALFEIKDVLLTTQVGLFEFFKAEQDRFDESLLADIERLREAAGAGAGGPQGVGGVDDVPQADKPESFFGERLGLTAIATGFSAALTGYASGFVKTLGEGFKDLGKTLRNTLKAFTPKPILNFLDDLVVRAYVIFDDFKKSFGGGIQKALAPFVNFGASLKAFFQPLLDLPKVFSLGGNSRIIGGIKEIAKSIGGFFGRIFSGMERIFRPLQLLIGVFNAGQKTLEEVASKNTTVLENFGIIIENLLTELTSALITMPAELIKDLISWIAGKLGFEEVEKSLDSFDIDEMFREGIGQIFDALTQIPEFLKSIGTRVSDFIYEQRKKVPFGFLGGISDEDIDLEAEQRIAGREITAAAQDVAAIDINQQNQDNPEYVAAMERYNQAVAKKSEIDQQLQQQAVESSQATAEGMEALADAGTTPGSIYTHDEHVVEKLNEINSTLGGDKPVQPTQSLISNFEKNIIDSSSPAIQNMNREMQRIDVSNMSFDVPVNSMLNAPIGRASKEVADASSSAPVIVAPSRGGDVVNNNVQNNTTNVIPAGAPSRSNSPAYLRLQDRMQSAS